MFQLGRTRDYIQKVVVNNTHNIGLLLKDKHN